MTRAHDVRLEDSDSLVVYADFAAPECYLASRRVDALVAAGIAVDWRAVEQNPRQPVNGRALVADDRTETEKRMAAVTALLLPREQLPWQLPRMVPNTEAAVSGYAEAYGAEVGDDVRRLLYAAYWVDGSDIGSPEVLRRRLTGPILRGRSTSSPLRDSGYAVAVSRGPITTSAWRRIRVWREEWVYLGTGEVPTLVAGDGSPSTGEAALRRLEKEILRAGAEIDPDLPDPAKFPVKPVRPPKTWVSEVGGTWSQVWKTCP
ncbi:DsbA family protein [Kribbella sp. NPDC003557]|uniref:DsbA family oxidoreductase n=1 Tax=Kribbella sp. NPDC003557 TaxID=3154449 RepID=UPI0033AAC57E